MNKLKQSKQIEEIIAELDYGKYKRSTALKLFDILANELSKQELSKEARSDIEQSQKFVKDTYDTYEGANIPNNTSFAFVVPTRILRGSDRYTSEVHQFLPILSHVNHSTRQRALMSMPPSIIGEYGKDSVGKQGRIIFAPVFGDMLHDFGSNLVNRYRLRRRVDMIMDDVADFAYNRLGADIIGLGAILPKVTDLGRRIKVKGLTTTTGHGGTVWLILETIKKVQEDKLVKPDGRFGVIGAGGAIASSTIELLIEKYPEAKITVRDKREEMNSYVRKRFDESHPGRVMIAKSNVDVLKSANIIVSAVTTSISLDKTGVDLSGKVIIDDSQPGSFDKAEVEKHGGILVWVVGSDQKDKPNLMRQHGFTFGEDGLASNSDLWGCEAEVGVLSAARQYRLAVDQPVNAEIIKNLDPILRSEKIGVAEYQAYGEKLDII